MATPAALLFVVTCVAQIITAIRGESADGGPRLASPSVADATSKRDGIGGGGAGNRISLGRHHHKHKKYSRHYSRPKPRGGNSQQALAEDGNSGSFDFYVYSMSYQPEFCRENSEKFTGCHSPQERWKGQLTIHGLWPNRNDGTWPSTCSKERFDLSLLQHLSEDLAQNWPNIKALSAAAPGHTAFWEHEWTKHGTCSGLAQQDYFNTALDLLLPTPDIVKENYGSLVKRDQLEEGVYLGGDMSVFVCKSGGYLSEVRLCYEKMADGAPGDRVSCPDSTLREDSCGDEIRIAAFDDAGVTTAAIK